MNIFYTNRDPNQCAREHCSIHRNKMIVESAQLLSTCHHVYGTATKNMCKPYHPKHPSCKWVCASPKHYNWLFEMALELCHNFEDIKDYEHNYYHKLVNHLMHPPGAVQGRHLLDTSRDWEDPYPAMPPEFACIPDRLTAYQTYLNFKFRDWRTRPNRPLPVVFDALDEPPAWYEE